MTTPKAERKRMIFKLVAIPFAISAFLFALWLSQPPEPGSGVRYQETATAASAVATAFAETVTAAQTPETGLSLPEVEATSTALFRELQTAQPLLFPAVSVTPEP